MNPVLQRNFPRGPGRSRKRSVPRSRGIPAVSLEVICEAGYRVNTVDRRQTFGDEALMEELNAGLVLNEFINSEYNPRQSLSSN